jgi:peptidoglycan/LPS O-acetylase OafA/YrhL
MQREEHERLDVLDGLRAVAIVLVIAFHYFSRWTPPLFTDNLYPYGDWLADFPLFRYGNFGVQLFFMVSGFVISLTLFNCETWLEFARKRFARLFPSMLLCSVLTYVAASVIPSSRFPNTVLDFVPSLSFVEPLIWTKLVGREFGVIDGVYWSLFIEVKFYFWACLLFFMFKGDRFLPAFCSFANVVLALVILERLAVPQLGPWLYVLFFTENLPWFAAGVGFYYLHRNRQTTMAWLLVMETAVVLSVESFLSAKATPAVLPIYAGFYVLFILIIYRQPWVSVLAYRPVALIGASSYSLYLLHQNIGVSVISAAASWLNLTSQRVTVLLAVAVAIAMMGAAQGIYKYWEMPWKRKILAHTSFSGTRSASRLVTRTQPAGMERSTGLPQAGISKHLVL